MEECSKELIDMILTKLIIEAPITQIDDEARTKLTECRGTYGEKYDVIVEISKMDSTKVSSFVKTLCALDKYYLRPIDEAK
jgi:hypothetical protein